MRIALTGRRRRAAAAAGLLAAAAALLAAFVGTGAASSTARPRNVVKPTISGTRQVGQTLTGNRGIWTGTEPITYAYQWVRCGPLGAGCVPIPGATGEQYTLVAADRGHSLRFVVTASNAEGSRTVRSNASGVVQDAPGQPPPPPAPPPPPPPPPPPGACVPIGSVSLPERLVVDRIRYTPSTIRSREEPLDARFHVVTTKGKCVSGALVYAVGVPFDRLSRGVETATGGDGWATIRFQIQPTFELRPGNLVVIFVRARKAGENLLAGVSSRRLVSVRVA